MTARTFDKPNHSMVFKLPVLSKEREVELAYRIREGDNAARDEFINSNLRLVIKFVSPFFNSDREHNDDLIQEGYVGLVDAVDNFDPKKERKFSTFAKARILAPVFVFFKKNRAMKLTERMQKDLNRVLRTARSCNIDVIDITSSEIELIAQKLNEQYPDKNKKEYKSDDIRGVIDVYSALRMQSLEYPSFNDEGRTLGECTEDITSESPDAAVSCVWNSKNMEEIISILNDDEREVIVRLHGLNGRTPYNYDSVVDELGLRKYKIKQIEALAFRKIKNRLPHLRKEIEI